jgi:hypothetical protein
MNNRIKERTHIRCPNGCSDLLSAFFNLFAYEYENMLNRMPMKFRWSRFRSREKHTTKFRRECMIRRSSEIMQSGECLSLTGAKFRRKRIMGQSSAREGMRRKERLGECEWCNGLVLCESPQAGEVQRTEHWTHASLTSHSLLYFSFAQIKNDSSIRFYNEYTWERIFKNRTCNIYF